jgi:hypothetical protein
MAKSSKMKPPVALPEVSYLRQLLHYEPHTGKLFWRWRSLCQFADVRNFHRWNKRYAGEEAFTATHKNGAKHGAIDWQPYVAHRVIWKLMTGQEPGVMVDHEDRNRSNNCWNNLRNVECFQNSINRSKHKNNTSGYPGVYFSKRQNRWKAQIALRNSRVHLGTFKKKSDAISARLVAEKKYHGEFSPRARVA